MVHTASPDRFLQQYFSWIRFALSLLLGLPVAVVAGTLAWARDSISATTAPSELSWLPLALLLTSGVLALCSWRFLRPLLKGWESSTEHNALVLERLIERLPPRRLACWIVIATTLSLLLELAFIRWMAALYEIFAFYKNFVLLACFAGLGTGYAVSNKRLVYSVFLPLLAIVVVAVLSFRFVLPDHMQQCLHNLPTVENLAMGMHTASSLLHFIAIYAFLATIFTLSALIFLPIGQICGRLMSRMENLRAYGFNLIGSLLGVLAIIALGQMWTPPVVWFAVAFALAVPMLSASRRSVTQAAFACAICLAALGAAVPFGSEYVYSPYQLLERGTGAVLKEMQIRAAGQYYQHILDLSKAAQADPTYKRIGAYYEMPYQFKPAADEVLVVGAGAGNDVAAALRCGAKHVDAVEIDPAIQLMGVYFHPEKPYANANVRAVIDDARQFLRKTPKKYDAIVFGLLDSHTATSQASQLRTDSYVYTLQSFSDAMNDLKDDGILCLSFSSMSPELDQKLKSMLKEVFHKEPLALRSSYDGSVILVSSKANVVALPPTLQPAFDRGDITVDKGNLPLSSNIDLSTDDWPFFYMAHKKFPLSYVPILVLVLILAAAMLRSFETSKAQFSFESFAFLLMGSGFMLIETKSITELALYFGNTWRVTGIVIAAIMIMAFLANLITDKFKPKNIVLPFMALLLSLGFGLYVHHFVHLSADGAGPLIATAVATLPIAFSGVVFSILLSRTRSINQAMSSNIFGALLGGAMEYLALWLGYEALYVIAVCLYFSAFLLCLPKAGQAGDAA